jgi:hypothetical protein
LKQYPPFREAFQEVKKIIGERALDRLNLVALGGIKTKTVVTIEHDDKPTKRITTEGETLPDVRALTHVLAIMDPARYALNKVYSGTDEDDGASLARTKQSMEALLGMTPQSDLVGVLKLTPREARE